jgi:Poly A polymerase head domain
VAPPASTARELLPVENLTLPDSHWPRPGDTVVSFEHSIQREGHLIGHTHDGRPYIHYADRISTPASFAQIRLAEPGHGIGPNWMRLPTVAKIFRPSTTETETFKRLLSQTIPPGFQYIRLLREIWSRGHEVFVVGGTVRDVLAGHTTQDVDVVTTMPLVHLSPLLENMCRLPMSLPPKATRNGHLRLGGSPSSGDPFIDLCVFKHYLPGTTDALFGASFERDVGHRDFACNSVYYDPMNDALIDPTGIGVADADRHILSIVADPELRSHFHYGQIIIRFFKFLARGFTPSDTCAAQVRERLIPSLSAMTTSSRCAYIKIQVLSKYPISEHVSRLDALRQQFISFEAADIWDKFVEPYRERVLSWKP